VARRTRAVAASRSRTARRCLSAVGAWVGSIDFEAQQTRMRGR
jgi:hypothetical protein